MVGVSQWVDGPYRLLPLPSTTMDRNEHASIAIADDMALFHNCIIRGVNAIYLQAPKVKGHAEIVDFLFFVGAWASWLIQHHTMEDEGLFDSFEEVANQRGLLAINQLQHKEFESGVQRMLALSKESPTDFNPDILLSEINNFGPAMHKHLAAEIETLLALRPYDHAQLISVYRTSQSQLQNVGEDVKMKSLPLMFGLHDASYEHGSHWPPFPEPIRDGLIQAYCAQHTNSWKFLPCDFHSQPRRLQC